MSNPPHARKWAQFSIACMNRARLSSRAAKQRWAAGPSIGVADSSGIRTGMKRAKSTGRNRRRQNVKVQWADTHAFPVPIPKNEPQRIAELKSYDVLDTPPEEVFDSITLLASHICATPIALITLIDSDRQWFKSKVGVSVAETSRDIAFCAHAIMEEDLLIVPDATTDKRFAGNPLVRSHPRIRFYAGAPLITRNHHALGTLCVIDRVPRKLTAEQREALRALSRQVMAQLESRRVVGQLQRRLAQQSTDHSRLLRKLSQADARKRGYEEALRRLRHEVRASNKAILNLANQAITAGPAPYNKRPLQSIRSLAQSLIELSG